MTLEMLKAKIDELERRLEVTRRDTPVVPSRIPVPSPTMSRVVVLPNTEASQLEDDSEQLLCRELQRTNPYNGNLIVGPEIVLDTWWPMANIRYQQYSYRYEPALTDGDEMSKGIALPVFDLDGRSTVWIPPLFTFGQANAQSLFGKYGKTSCFPTPEVL